MHLAERFVATVAYVASFFSFASVQDLGGKLQKPLFDSLEPNDGKVPTGGPVFKPPTGTPIDHPGGDLVCDYSRMGPQWTNCSEAGNRGCWLRNIKNGKEFNILLNYEDPANTPIGIDRYYNISATDGIIDADGVPFTHGKFFWEPSDPGSWDSRYPGPWIQACWGDTVHINVYNNLTYNGTTVHWHGIRQWNTFEADGVPGVTQCPIAPKDNFTYNFRAMQYGSSWYHSHFSLQYADGAAGPMADYPWPNIRQLGSAEETDYVDRLGRITSMNVNLSSSNLCCQGHNSAFQAIWPNIGLGVQSTLLNGVGNVTRWNNDQKNTSEIPEPYSLSISSKLVNGRPMRYLLRLINISFESHFVFSIDNHNLTVVSSDFVAVKPYNTSSVRIGVGQRHNVILIAQRLGSTATSFWMRTYRPSCFDSNLAPSKGYEKAGVVFYDGEKKKPDETAVGWDVDTTSCTDEPYASLVPMVEWKVGEPRKEETSLEVVYNPADPGVEFPLAQFSIGGRSFNPLLANYSNPLILNLTWSGVWNPRWVVFPEDYQPTDWVYLLLRGGAFNHPIHLHGHDFAIIAESTAPYPDDGKVTLKKDNPPRRDVVMLPESGFVMIAFPTDNPGPWIMHCHIAQHASWGLALNIVERQSAAQTLAVSSGAITQAQQTCDKWNAWYSNCTNWWYDANQGQKPGFYCPNAHQPDMEKQFSPDSGI